MKSTWLLILLFPLPLLSQGLFDEAVGSGTDKSDQNHAFKFELNGFIRGAFWAGEIPDSDQLEMKSGYGETSLKLRVRKDTFGDAFTEIRFRHGTELNSQISEVALRECYVNIYTGHFDFRIGHQIIVWGRADGYNPTNNLTPQNMLVRSADEDDRREGNFLLRGNVSYYPIRLEGILVPAYSSSILPLDLFPLLEGVKLSGQEMPGTNLNRVGFALKLNLELAAFDGSISWFHGYNPMPGVTGMIDGTEIMVRTKPYRATVIGADFSTTIGSIGLRGEFAWRDPEGNYEAEAHIPNPDLQYILGIDKQYGDFSIILQYIGRSVIDFTTLTLSPLPDDDMIDLLFEKNRMIASQMDECSHTISVRPALTLMHEILTLEVMSMFNLTTKERMIRPKISYAMADALTLTAGGEFYTGPENTLYGTIDEALSAIFIELKTSF